MPGGALLAAALADNEGLEEVVLDGCRLGPAGVSAMSAVLVRSRNLLFVNLSNNGGGLAASNDLLRGLHCNTLLRTLVYAGSCGLRGVAEVAELRAHPAAATGRVQWVESYCQRGFMSGTRAEPRP